MNESKMGIENDPKNEKSITDEFWRSEKINKAFEICGFPYMDPESLEKMGEGKLGGETGGHNIFKTDSTRPDGAKMTIIIERKK